MKFTKNVIRSVRDLWDKLKNDYAEWELKNHYTTSDTKNKKRKRKTNKQFPGKDVADDLNGVRTGISSSFGDEADSSVGTVVNEYKKRKNSTPSKTVNSSKDNQAKESTPFAPDITYPRLLSNELEYSNDTSVSNSLVSVTSTATLDPSSVIADFQTILRRLDKIENSLLETQHRLLEVEKDSSGTFDFNQNLVHHSLTSSQKRLSEHETILGTETKSELIEPSTTAHSTVGHEAMAVTPKETMKVTNLKNPQNGRTFESPMQATVSGQLEFLSPILPKLWEKRPNHISDDLLKNNGTANLEEDLEATKKSIESLRLKIQRRLEKKTSTTDNEA
ncbi:hypothetical protein SJAG_03772 [Schizosaccharomyces japonicus yFS275]|uniref:Uncharacterized protein n=1 Tax=Schizosaccharomyces japonicus (strain yFS275 / FY16936) TaxID=402676 RepID=B6K505_SCHJY|nr:hypothetical protein SJAG_03772 [Schizosaccharomyces japonicus yFS275]EEB08609.1 hypothetical protein SJAG_03772 [Schizosaccharomyces japonicus yFS275]